MPHHYHFRSSGIDPGAVDERAERLGFENRSEYIRHLIREDINRGLVEGGDA